ncbi:MAG: alkaline phosphatase D family protein [Actinomycetota bacterium]
MATRSLPAGGRPKRKKRKKKPDEPLFADGFKRRDRKGWGAEWFNQRYERNWSIKDRRGLIRLPASESNVAHKPIPVLVLDHDVKNVDLRASISVSNKTARAGLITRMVGYADLYAAHIGPGNVVKIIRSGIHNHRVLRKRRFQIDENRRYRIRMQIRGASPVTIRCKVWPAGKKEPTRWTLEAKDDSKAAIGGVGAFGIYTMHAADGRGAVVRVSDVVARSQQDPRSSPPAITYSLAGVPYGRGTTVKVVAKVAVPARVFFEYGTDPALATGARRVRAGLINSGALVAKETLDLTALDEAAIVYWRAVAERKGARVEGPISSFKPRPAPGLPIKFAFGACTQWTARPHRSFRQALLKLPDFFLHQGDFGYVAHRVIDHASDTYQDHWTRMLADPHLVELTRDVPFSFYRDDADYGRNQAHARTLRRFTIAAHQELHANPSNDHFDFRYGDVAIFCIDCRRYSTGKVPDKSKRSKLGSAQKRWLKDGMRAARDDGAGLLIVASPQAFGSDATPAAWRKSYADEWRELIDFFGGLGAPVLIISGDSHGHRLFEFPQKSLPDGTPRIVEFLSAGTEQKRFSDEIDPEFLIDVGKNKEPGFGLVEVGPPQTVGGQTTRSLGLAAVRTRDGTEMWRRSYLIVEGLGILPDLL